MFFDVFLLSFQFDRFVASSSSIIIICLTWFRVGVVWWGGASGLRGRRGGGSGFCSDAGLEAFYFSGEVTDASILALAMEIPTLVSPKGGETRVGHPRE